MIKPGDKVVAKKSFSGVKKNQVYTVKNVTEYETDGHVHFDLEEVTVGNWFCAPGFELAYIKEFSIKLKDLTNGS